jgi:hypothetical protein
MKSQNIFMILFACVAISGLGMQVLRAQEKEVRPMTITNPAEVARVQKFLNSTPGGFVMGKAQLMRMVQTVNEPGGGCHNICCSPTICTNNGCTEGTCSCCGAAKSLQ